MPNVHVRSVSNPQARTKHLESKYLDSTGTYEVSRVLRHVRSISGGLHAYVDSRMSFSSLCPPEVVSCAGARAASGAG